MMHVYNRMLHLFSALLISFGVSAQSDLVITGVMDGPLSGGTPKVLELYVMSDVADASTYSVYRYSNGGTSAYSVYTFPAIALTAGQHYTIASDSANYYAFFWQQCRWFRVALYQWRRHCGTPHGLGYSGCIRSVWCGRNRTMLGSSGRMGLPEQRSLANGFIRLQRMDFFWNQRTGRTNHQCRGANSLPFSHVYRHFSAQLYHLHSDECRGCIHP